MLTNNTTCLSHVSGTTTNATFLYSPLAIRQRRSVCPSGYQSPYLLMHPLIPIQFFIFACLF